MTFNEIFRVIIINYKKILSATIIGSVLLFVILFFAFPLTFEARVSILPPENKSGTGLGALLQGSDFSSLVSQPGGANAQLYAEILKSRIAAEYVVKKMNLMAFLQAKSFDAAVNKLSLMLTTEVTKEGIIKLSVPVTTSWFGGLSSEKDSIRILSAELSNTYAEALDYINRDKLASKSKKARIYIEEQITITKTKLDSAEKELMEFQQVNKTVSLSDQLKVSIETAAKLKGEIINTEINLGMLSQNLNENSSTVLGLKTKLEELKQQYNKIESRSNDFLVAFKDAPELGLKLSSIYREVRILNEVYLLLQQQYYKEKIQENRDLPTVEILDKAIPPLNKSAPKVVFSTVFGGIFIFLAMSLITLLEQKNLFKYLKIRKEENV